MAAMCSEEEADKSAACKRIEGVLGQALTADEANRVGDALSLYADAEMQINRLNQQLCGRSDAKLKKRLNAYMTNIISRKEALSERLDFALPVVPSAPPSYDSPPPLPEPTHSIARPAAPEGECLLELSQDDAQMYSVSAEGQVSVPSYPSRLSVQRLRDSGTPYLRLGDWSCPLLPGETPALLTGEGMNTVMLPDPASVRTGDSVAVVLPSKLPAAEKGSFLHLLANLTRLMVTDAFSGLVREVRETDLSPQPQQQRQPQPQSRPWPQIQSTQSIKDVPSSENTQQRQTSDKVADGIKATSQIIARGLSWGADKGSALIQIGTSALRNRIEQSQGGGTLSEPAPVDPRIAQGANVAREGTHVAVNTSVKAVGVVGRVAKSVATWAAPYVRDGAARILPESWTQGDENGHSKTQAAVTVASAALSGFGNVYEALEQGAKLVGRATADGTAGVVGARYGSQAGRVTENVLYSVGNVGMTVHNVRQIGPKAIAKTMAVDTAHKFAQQGQRRSSAHQ